MQWRAQLLRVRVALVGFYLRAPHLHGWLSSRKWLRPVPMLFANSSRSIAADPAADPAAVESHAAAVHPDPTTVKPNAAAIHPNTAAVQSNTAAVNADAAAVSTDATAIPAYTATKCADVAAGGRVGQCLL